MYYQNTLAWTQDSFQMTVHTEWLPSANIFCKGRPKWSFAKRKLLLKKHVQTVPMKSEDSLQVISKQELWTVFDQNSQKTGSYTTVGDQSNTLHSREQD